jgi:hypothetical protein
MKEATIHIDESQHPVDFHFTGEPDRPISAFLLLAHVPAEPPGAILLTHGNSNLVGNLLMTLYQRSVHEFPEMAMVMEEVSRGIIKFCDAERGRWETTTGNA